MRKLKTLFALLVLSFFTIGNVWADTETITEGFETATTSTNYQGTVTVATNKSDCGISWEIFYGTVSTSSKILGNNSAAMRLYTTANYGYLKTTTAITDLTQVAFKAKAATSNSASIKIDVKYSTNNGTSWSPMKMTSATGDDYTNQSVASSATTYTAYVPSGVTGDILFQIAINSASTKPSSGSAQLTVDSVAFTYVTTTPSVSAKKGNNTVTSIAYGTVKQYTESDNSGTPVQYMFDTITLKGSNLTAAVTLAATTTGGGAIFDVEPKSIATNEWDGNGEKEVVVSMATGAAGNNFAGTLTISSDNDEFDDVEISLSGTVTPRYTIEVADGIEHGSFTWTDGENDNPMHVDAGTIIEVTPVPSAGYAFTADSWDIYRTDNSSTKVVNVDGMFEMPAYNVTINGSFEEITTPTVSATPSSLSFGTHRQHELGAEDTEYIIDTIVITGAALNSAINLKKEDEAGSAYFTLSYNGNEISSMGAGVNINPEAGNINAKVVVKASTSTNGTHATNLIIHSNGSEFVNVAVPLSITLTETYAVAVAVNDANMGSATLNGGTAAIYAAYEDGLTLVATPKSGYEFVNWTLSADNLLIDDEDAASTTANTIVGATTITANFRLKPTFTWVVNGEETTETANTGATLTQKPTPAATLGGKTFIGWTTTPIVGEAVSSTYVENTPIAMPEGGATYYAVYAQIESEAIVNWDLVTNVSSLHENDIITFTSICEYTTNKVTYKDPVAYAGKNGDLGAVVPIGITNNKIREVKSGTIGEIKLVAGSTNGKWKLYDMTDHYISGGDKKFGYGESGRDATIQIDGETYAATVKFGTSDSLISYNPNNNAGDYAKARFAHYKSVQKAIQIYKKTVTPAVCSAYATNQYQVTFNPNPSDGTVTIKNGETPISSGNKFWKGTTLDVVATATTSGYKLVTLTANGADIKGAMQFTIGTADVTIFADFEDATALDNLESEVKAVKVLVDGQIFILRDGKTYTIQGQLVK